MNNFYFFTNPVLQKIGDRTTETAVVLHEFDIATEEFSPNVMACLPSKDWVVTEENSKGRTDLRHLQVCSIDPPGCKDIDDALHCRTLANGHLECGVHIADVTHFVKEGSALDIEGCKRATSTYLVERRLDMLPGLLTTTLCSLVGHVDRFAFSILWEFDKDLNVVKTDFVKSVIHSKKAMSYGEAQEWLDQEQTPSKGSLQESVRSLNKIAKVLRQRRVDKGALALASPEVRFKIDDESHDTTDVELYDMKEANLLVEEFMLLANITVATKVTEVYPRFSMLRRHPKPSPEMFKDLLAMAKAAKLTMDVSSSKALANSLDLAVRQDDAYFNKLVRILATRCMQQAVYFGSGDVSVEEYLHYGLASPIYTHFTSPIRRYADVVVHRLLAGAMSIAPLPTKYESKETIRDIANNINLRHHNAQLAGRASVALHTVVFFKKRPAETMANVSKVDASSVSVMVPEFGIQGKLSELGELVDFEEDSLSVSTQEGRRLAIFDQVKVRLEVETLPGYRDQLKVVLLDEDREPAKKKQKRKR